LNPKGDVTERYYGTYRDDYDYAGQLYLDLAYEAMKNVTVGIGGRNIFNVFPDKIANGVFPSTGGQPDGELYPRTGGPFGFNGVLVRPLVRTRLRRGLPFSASARAAFRRTV